MCGPFLFAKRCCAECSSIVVNMAASEQFEIWAQNSSGDGWHMVAAFADIEVATAVANARTPPVKLVHAFYENGRRQREEVLAEMGTLRRPT
jgi:hypothetical protein